MIKKASLLTACSVTAFSAWAQDTSPDTLVVTANRFEQPRSTVLAPTTVVTRQDIDRWQSTSVNDVLRRLPGVDITQNGGSGQLSSIFIRGTNASHVLVLIDGVRLNLAGVVLLILVSSLLRLSSVLNISVGRAPLFMVQMQ